MVGMRAQNTTSIRLLKHEAVLGCGSFEVRVAYAAWFRSWLPVARISSLRAAGQRNLGDGG